MANYALRCDDPSTAIDQIGAALASLSDMKEAVNSLNNTLNEHVGNIGEANGQLVEKMIAIGGKAMQENIDMTMATMKDALLDPAFDAYIMKYGSRHEKDNRADL